MGVWGFKGFLGGFGGYAFRVRVQGSRVQRFRGKQTRNNNRTPEIDTYVL